MATSPRVTATLREVATLAQVHVSTASRALDPKRRHLIGDEVLARVDAAARKLKYRQNRAAATLRTGRSMTVAVLTPTVVNPVIPPMLDGIEAGLAAGEYVPFLFHTASQISHEQIAQRLFSHRPDGVILWTAVSQDPILKIVRSLQLPFVVVGPATLRGMVVVHGDDHAGMKMAVSHLVALGHRRIVHLAGPVELLSAQDRAQAFKGACDEHGIEGFVRACDGFSREAGRAACAGLLTQRNAGFTAICAASDVLALGAYDALSAAGLSVPKDISVTGFNDIAFMDLVHPALTTVHVPHREIGLLAAKRLLEQLDEKVAQPERVTGVHPRLVVRASTAKPGQGAAPKGRKLK